MAIAFTGSGNTRTFTAPSVNGDYLIRVTAQDSSTPPRTTSATKTMRVGAAVTTFAGKQAKPVVGMLTNATAWATRMTEVNGAGRVNARRIYASFVAGGQDQMTLIQATLNAGMLPVISYTGTDLSFATATGQALRGLGQPVAVIWGDDPTTGFTAGDFIAQTKAIMPLLAGPNISRGPAFNATTLDLSSATFDAYVPDELFDGDYWEWFGAICYQSGSVAIPSTPRAVDRLNRVSAWLDARSRSAVKIAVTEYVGYTVPAMAAFDEGMFTNPKVWLGCIWNSTSTTRDWALTGTRLTQFKDVTLADTRKYQPV